jgi:hypothetical protein
MYDKIDIVKSKKKDRLVKKNSLIYWLFHYSYYISICSLCIFCGKELMADFASAMFLYTIGAFVAYSAFAANKLKRIQGSSKEQNRTLIKQILEQQGWYLRNDTQQYTVAFQKCGVFSDFNEMTIIYDKQDILINCIAYSEPNTESPFHWFVNRNLERKLVNKFI